MSVVTCTITDGVADVRLNRPDKLNSLNPELFDALVAEGERLRDVPGLRAVVLSGEGRGFCSGLDFAMFEAMGGDDFSITDAEKLERPEGDPTFGLHHGQRAVRVWSVLPVPVIAAVSGPALGGGFQLMLGADIRIVAPDAKLGLLEVPWGLIPDMTGTQILPRLVGVERAKELVFTGRIIDGAEAVRIGLALRTSDDPRTDALALAREIAGQNPHAVRWAKTALDATWTASMSDGFAVERRAIGELIGSPNQTEAVAARFGKRTPKFED